LEISNHHMTENSRIAGALGGAAFPVSIYGAQFVYDDFLDGYFVDTRPAAGHA
jgi:hypothetical protein